MRNQVKRFVAALLAFTMIASSSVFASEETEVNLDGLRVSDEFAAKHPNGMFEVLSPLIQTEEGKEFDFIVVRRGGTEGDVSVNLKVIEAIAKYDEDFVLMEKGALGLYHEIKKSEDNPTILESYIEENKDMVLTSDRAVSGSAIDVIVDDSLVSGNSLEIGDEEELTETSTEVTTEAETEAETETIEYTAGLGSYTSFLHKMKDEATGAKSAENAEVSNKLDDVFEIRDEKAIEETNEVTRNLKGLSYMLDFKDGEAYKTIRVKIKDDNIYESQEEFSLSLYDPTNGAELGDALSSNIFIDDNDKVEYADINFETSELSVYKDSESAVVKLIRSGNTNDFVNVSVSTLADSAKADEHYIPIMGEIMFLPGETEKTILIPILTKNINMDDSLFFDLTAETKDNANIGTNKVRIEIKPYENRDNTSLVAMSAENGGTFGNASSSNEADVNIEPMETSDIVSGIVPYGNFNKSVNAFHSGTSSIDGHVDLTGVEYITWSWEMTGVSASKYKSRQVSTVRVGDISRNKFKTFSRTNETISSNELVGRKMRTTNQYWKINAYVSTSNKINLNVYDFACHLTNFSFNTAAPDALKAYTYKNAKDKLPNSEVSFNPGNTRVSSPTITRGNYIYADGDLSTDGEKYGCTVKNVIITGNNKSLSMEPKAYKRFDSDFIKTYVYNEDQTQKSLTAKAVYERTSKVRKINIGQYDSNMGSLKIDGKIYNNQSITSNQWCKGDKLVVDAVPNQGYNLQKIVVGNKEYKSGDAVTLEEGMTVMPVFQKDNNTVSVVWDQLGTGINEDHDTNMQHGVVVSSATDTSVASGFTTVNLSTNKDYYNLLSETEKKQVYLAYLEKYKEKLNCDLDTYFAENQLPEVYKLYIKNKCGITDEKEQYKYLSVDNTEKIMRYYAAGGKLNNSQKVDAKANIYKKILAKLVSKNKTAKTLFPYSGNVFTGKYSFDYRKFSTMLTLASYISQNIEKLNDEQFEFLFSDLSGFDYKNDTDGVYLFYLSKDEFPSVNIEGVPTFDEYIKYQLPVSFKNKIEANLKETRNKEIKEKYASNPELFDNIKLNNLSVGDVVTLFAVVDDGYTCLWSYSDDENKAVKDSEQSALALHVGDSFTFTVKDSSATVNFYFEKSDNLNSNALIKGRIVKSKDTLLKQSYFGVNINNPNTYIPLPGVDVTMGNIDPTKSKVINGNTYYSSGQTDENGYFTIYAPNAINNLFTSVLFSDGDKQYVKDAIIKKNMPNVVFEVPFMDSKYKFEYLNFNNNGSGKSEIEVEDETRKVTAKINVEEGYNVSKVVLRSYDAKGNLVKAWQMVGEENNTYTSSFNSKEYLRAKGKLTVEAYDIYGKGRGEVETGYTFHETPASGNANLPDMENLGGATLDVIGDVIPGLSLGQYDVTPERESNTDGTNASDSEKYEITVLSGDIMKQKIKESVKNGETTFTTGTIAERVSKMTSAISSITSVKSAAHSEWGKAAKKDASKGSFYTSGGKATLDVNLDVGFYMSLHSDIADDGSTRYVFDQLYGLLGVIVDAQKDFGFVVGPVPVYVTIAGRIGVKGLIGVMPTKDSKNKIAIGEKKGWFNDMVKAKSDTKGEIGIFPFLSLGTGVGYRGAFSVGVSGQMNMAIVYQPWKDGAGTVEFSLNVDIDLAVIPLSFAVASIKYGMFYTKNYTPNSWVDFSNVSNAGKFSNFKPMSVIDSEINNMTGEIRDVARAKNGNSFETSLKPFSDEDTNIELLSEKSLRGTLKHPKPVVTSLGGKKQIMFYLGDDGARADYDCQAVYYTIYDGNSWLNPMQLDNNGTYDSDFSVSSIGNDRVMIVWGDSNKTFGDSMPNVSEYLNSIDLKYCVFEADGTKNDVVQLTKDDNFSNTMPAITYDSETGRIMIAYTVTDYSDTKVEFSYETMDDLNGFLNNAYSTIAYKMLDSSFNEVGYSSNEVSYMSYEDNYGEGSLDNQRFAAVTLMNDVPQLNINEMSVSSYNKKAYLTYTIDTDGDSSTTEDMEIYATVISYEDNSSVGPIRVTNNDVYDSNPHTVKYDDKVWLYWNNNNNVVCTDFENAVESNVVKNTDGTYEVDSTYFSFDTVQEGADAATTFTVSLEPDGYVYMLWNQLENFDDESAVIDKDDLYGLESTAAFVTKRSLYMRVYDPHYEKETIDDEETGSYDVYSGKWGSAVRIDEPAEGDTIYNEQSFSSKDTENTVAVFRRNKLVDNGKGGKMESDNSDLVIHNYRLVSTLDFDENSVYISPEHPAPDDDAILYVNVDNVGVLPSDTVTFEATMEDDKGNVTPLGTYTYNTHIATDSTVEGAIPFNMPEGAEYIKFNVKAWEDNLTDSADEFTYTFKSGSELGMLDLELQRVDNDEGYIEGTLVNYGNKGTGNMTFEVASGTDIMSNLLDGNSEYNVIYSTTLDSLEPGDTLEIDSLVDISDIWGENKSAEIYITISNDDGTLYDEDFTISKFSDEDIVISDIVVNNGDTTPITVNEADSVYPKVKIAPNGADANYSLEYNVQDSDIATVDPSSGKITGVKAGKTKFIIKAIRQDYSYFVDTDGVMYNPDGTVVEFNENGNAVNLFDAEEGYVAMTKEVDIAVNSLDVKEVIEDETEITTEEEDEETTVESSGKLGHGSSRNLGKGTAKTTTEAQTEESTEAVDNIDNTDNEKVDTDNSFTDIADHWAKDVINFVADLGVVKGYEDNTFRPNNSITRAELLTILYNSGLADTTDSNVDADFDDVSGNEWYYDYIKWGVENNLIVGYNDNTFKGDNVISRQETAVVISKFIELANIELEQSEPIEFDDADSIAQWAKEYVDAISAFGIATGDNNNCYLPTKDLTRAETAAIIGRILK